MVIFHSRGTNTYGPEMGNGIGGGSFLVVELSFDV